MQCMIKHEDMASKSAKDIYLGLFVLFLIEGSSAFHIVHCDSNKINTVNWNNVTKKAIIKHDETTNISLPYDGQPVSIWCESNVPFKECLLSHLRYNNTKEETRCRYSPISNHKENVSCQSKRSIFVQSYDGYSCKFHFHKLTETGKS